MLLQQLCKRHHVHVALEGRGAGGVIGLWHRQVDWPAPTAQHVGLLMLMLLLLLLLRLGMRGDFCASRVVGCTCATQQLLLQTQFGEVRKQLCGFRCEAHTMHTQTHNNRNNTTSTTTQQCTHTPLWCQSASCLAPVRRPGHRRTAC